MSSEIITDEELEKILLYTAKVLPNAPSERGMTPSTIKTFFYKYIKVLVDIINRHFEGIETSKNVSMNEHNTSNNAHEDIRSYLQDLSDKDVELGNQIANQIKEHNQHEGSHSDIRELIASTLNSHNTSNNAHEDIRSLIETTGEIAQIAYDTAFGKAKIIPVKDAYEMLEKINYTLSVGDRFILEEENVPDFTVFARESTDSEAIELSQLSLLMGTELIPGKKYICDGFLLVASESGIDTSLLAKKAELSALEEVIAQNEKDAEQRSAKLTAELEKKETKKALVTSSEETVTLATDTEFNLGLRTSIILALPDEVSDEFEVIVNFRSGATATAFNAPESILFTQDDCYQGALTPIRNRLYEINIKNVDGILVGKVGCADYEVIEG